MKRTIQLSTHTLPESLVIRVEGETEILEGGPNEFTEWASQLGEDSRFENSLWPVTPSPATPCIFSKLPGIVLHTNRTDGDELLALHPQLMRRLFLLSLHPDEYRCILEHNPRQWWIHDDFYTDEGEAIQPKVAVPSHAGILVDLSGISLPIRNIAF